MIESLDERGLVVRSKAQLQPPAAAAPFLDGIHMLCPAGPVTLIDVKWRRFSPLGLLMRPRRELAKLWHRAKASP